MATTETTGNAEWTMQTFFEDPVAPYIAIPALAVLLLLLVVGVVWCTRRRRRRRLANQPLQQQQELLAAAPPPPQPAKASKMEGKGGASEAAGIKSAALGGSGSSVALNKTYSGDEYGLRISKIKPFGSGSVAMGSGSGGARLGSGSGSGSGTGEPGRAESSPNIRARSQSNGSPLRNNMASSEKASPEPVLGREKSSVRRKTNASPRHSGPPVQYPLVISGPDREQSRNSSGSNGNGNANVNTMPVKAVTTGGPVTVRGAPSLPLVRSNSKPEGINALLPPPNGTSQPMHIVVNGNVVRQPGKSLAMMSGGGKSLAMNSSPRLPAPAPVPLESNPNEPEVPKGDYVPPTPPLPAAYATSNTRTPSPGSKSVAMHASPNPPISYSGSGPKSAQTSPAASRQAFASVPISNTRPTLEQSSHEQQQPSQEQQEQLLPPPPPPLLNLQRGSPSPDSSRQQKHAAQSSEQQQKLATQPPPSPLQRLSLLASQSSGKSQLGYSQENDALDTPRYQQESTQMTLIPDTDYLSIPAFVHFETGRHFRPLKKLGSGGMAIVWIAEVVDPELRERLRPAKQCIAKVMRPPKPERGQPKDAPPSAASIERHTKMFEQEVSIGYFLSRHPNIAKTIGYATEPHNTILMHFYELGALETLLFEPKQAPFIVLTSRIKTQLFQDCIRGLEFMHNNSLAHCDIKPANILLTRSLGTSDGRIMAVLSDFGVARILDDMTDVVAAFQIHNINAMSRRYAAPEVLARFHKFSGSRGPPSPAELKAGDVFSSAILLYEMLTLRRAW